MHAPATLEPFALSAPPAPSRRRVVFARPAVRPAARRERRAGAGLPPFLARLGEAGVGLLLPLAVLGLWSLAAAQKWLPANLLPSPSAVVASFRELLASGDLLSNLGVSLLRVAKGFLVGGGIGLALGIAMGFSPKAERWIGPPFRLVAQIPSIALIPLLIQLLGIEEGLKLFVMAKACAIPVTIASSEGIRNIPAQYVEVAKVLRLRRWTVIRKVILPGALPSLFTGIRQGLSHVWVSLVAVEILASSEGIGYLMAWGRTIFQLDVVLVCVAVIGGVGFVFDFALKRAEARLLKWRDA